MVRTTCPRDCYDACGVLVAVRDGEIRHVRGDPDHHVSRGKLCTKCSIAYNGVLRDSEARLTQPLRRVGPKGSGRFEPVSWDEALGEIAARLGGIVAGPGPATILNTHYTGTCALLGMTFPQRFFNRLGATEVDPDTICNKAGYEALSYLYGESDEGFDPETANAAHCILVWGANPSASAPHQHEHWLADAPGTVVVVDPIRTPTAAAADLHLQPFPGSDAALAFAFAHVLRRDGLVDRDFVAAHTSGFDELEPLLEPCTPEWGEETTGVPAALIERAAQAYGAGPSLLWLGQGFQRQPRGGNALRAVATLPALTGNLGRPGSGWAYVTGSGSRRIDDAYLAAGHLLTDAPPSVSQMDLADVLTDPTRAQAIFCWNINIAASNPRLGDLRRALERDDLLTVVIDLFQTDTADLADYVLPASSFLESDDLVCSYFHHTLSAQVKAAEPPGEGLPNSEIFRRLAACMGYVEPELYERDRDVIDGLLQRTGFGIGWDDLKRSGTVRLYPEPRLQFADLAFATPSGRIEIASEVAVAAGQPRVAEPWHDELPARGRLRLLSPASPWALNSSFANDPRIARKLGPPTVTLHPDDASARGLADGDRAALETPTGRLCARVVTDPLSLRGVAYCPKGHWPKLTADNANVNTLNPGDAADMARSTAVHGVEVTVAPFVERP
ncbi:MAG: dehydrogenase [Thermoleophilia bacterium]|nr:dehydrogenase [Thermoleophilia bacterium]